MANYYTLLTPAGLAKVTNAQLTNEKVEITQVAVGDANGTGYTPSGTETALKREVWRGGVASVEVDAQNPNWIVIEAIVPSSVGGFTMREVALFDTAGDMIAIGNYPDTYKPIANDGSTMDLALRTIIEVNNASNVTLKVDPNVIVASRAYVDAKVAGAIGGIGTDLTTLDERVTTHLAEKTSYDAVLVNGFTGRVKFTELAHGLVKMSVVINNVPTVASATEVCSIPMKYNPTLMIPVETLKTNISPFDTTCAFAINNNVSKLLLSYSNGLSVANSQGLQAEVIYYVGS